MSGFALGLVLSAAILHATWNAIVKANGDRALTLGAVSATHAVAGLVLACLWPAPASVSWPMILTSTLVHYGYYLLLFHSYRHGDLSQVYPISRGMAPALVATASYVVIGENLGPAGWLGVGLVSTGVGFLALQRGAASTPRSTIILAVLLGLCIATYSVADGIGIRRSGSPIGYMGWLFLFEVPVPLTVALSRRRSGGGFARRTIFLGLIGGALAVLAYGLVLFAKTLAPLGAVSAVRESSVVIAAMIGVFIFGERPWRGRLAAAVIVACGVILLALAG